MRKTIELILELIFQCLTLKRRLITPSKMSHFVFPLTPIDPIRYACVF